jgi:hypothetical protein
MTQTTAGRPGALTEQEITTAADALADSARTVLEGIDDPADALAQRVADIAAACLDMLVDDQHDGGDHATRIVDLNDLLRFHGYDELAYSDEDIAAITGEDRATLRQLVAQRNAALAAEARRVAAFAEIAGYVSPAALLALIEHGRPVEPVEDEHDIGLRDAVNTIENVLSKHGLVADGDGEPEPAAGAAAESGIEGNQLGPESLRAGR